MLHVQHLYMQHLHMQHRYPGAAVAGSQSAKEREDDNRAKR